MRCNLEFASLHHVIYIYVYRFIFQSLLTACRVCAGYMSSRPLESVCVNGKKKLYDDLGSGYSLPGRVIAEGGVRNPALLNRPFLASHRDPQPDPRESDSGFHRAGAKVPQGPSMLLLASGRSFSFLNGGSSSTAQHAVRDSLSPGIAAVSFLPNFFSMQNPAATSNMRAFAATLATSYLLTADISQLGSLAGDRHAANLKQLRVVNPSPAISRQNTALASVQNPAATVADGRKHQQDRAVEAQPPQPKSALDVVADAAAAESANEEPSELLI